MRFILLRSTQNITALKPCRTLCVIARGGILDTITTTHTKLRAISEARDDRPFAYIINHGVTQP